MPPTLLTIANEVIESAGRLLVCHLSNHFWLVGSGVRLRSSCVRSLVAIYECPQCGGRSVRPKIENLHLFSLLKAPASCRTHKSTRESILSSGDPNRPPLGQDAIFQRTQGAGWSTGGFRFGLDWCVRSLRSIGIERHPGRELDPIVHQRIDATAGLRPADKNSREVIP